MYLLVILSDSRVDNWLFMSSPWPTLTLTALYLLICYTGPKLMENRKPWDLKAFIVIYNFCLVLLSAYMFIEVSEFFYLVHQQHPQTVTLDWKSRKYSADIIFALMNWIGRIIPK